jgi:hypothetical protein
VSKLGLEEPGRKRTYTYLDYEEEAGGGGGGGGGGGYFFVRLEQGGVFTLEICRCSVG